MDNASTTQAANLELATNGAACSYVEKDSVVILVDVEC